MILRSEASQQVSFIHASIKLPFLRESKVDSLQENVCVLRPLAKLFLLQLQCDAALALCHKIGHEASFEFQVDGLGRELAHSGEGAGPWPSSRPVPGGFRPGSRMVSVLAPDLCGRHWPCALPPSGTLLDLSALSLRPIESYMRQHFEVSFAQKDLSLVLQQQVGDVPPDRFSPGLALQGTLEGATGAFRSLFWRAHLWLVL